MRFSILLPTHNRADVLKVALESILAQTEQDFEVLVVGDGCTDNSAAVVKSFCDERIIWFDLPKGPNFGYANRNLALKKARGELIAFLAHDDIWLPDHLSLCNEAFKNDPELEIVYTLPLFVQPDGRVIPIPFNLNDEDLRKNWANRWANAIPAGAFVHRRSCFGKYGYWNDTLERSADWDLWIRFMRGGEWKRFAYVPQATCLHFKAIWRRDPDREDFEVPVIIKTIEKMSLPVERVNLDFAENKHEQEHVWDLMKQGGNTWVEDFRRSMSHYLDRCTWLGQIKDELEPTSSNPQSNDISSLVYKSVLYNHGIPFPKYINNISISGIYQDLGGEFWLTQGCEITTIGTDRKLMVKLFLSSGGDRFDLSISRNGELVKTLHFTHRGQCHIIRLGLSKDVRFKLFSDSIRLNRTKTIVKLRDMTIGRERTIKPFVLLRRMLASTLKHERKPL
jgi:glycosyltransferase involved in cell wall biosynthesis